MKHTIPVTFKNPEIKDVTSTQNISLNKLLSGAALPLASKRKDSSYTLNCEIVHGQAANEIIIRSILPDKRGISVLLDEGWIPPVLLPHQEIAAITVFEIYRKPSTIFRLPKCKTDADAWLGYMGSIPVSIELTDGTVLRGNIEPSLKEARKEIIHHENVQRVSKAKEKYQKILPDAKWGKKQLNRLRKQTSKAGKSRRKYRDKKIIKVFQTYKTRNPKQSLATAIENIITKKEQYPDEYIDYNHPETLLRRLKPIAHPKKPFEWRKSL